MDSTPSGSWPEVERRNSKDRRSGLDRRDGVDRRILPDKRTGERRQPRTTAVYADGYPDRRSHVARRSGQDRRGRGRRTRCDRRLEPLFPPLSF
jgi:hypothetical protein